MEDYSDYSAPELVRMLGGRFKDYRLRANMTQKEVAGFLGISQSYISRLEKKIMRRLKKEVSAHI